MKSEKSTNNVEITELKKQMKPFKSNKTKP